MNRVCKLSAALIGVFLTFNGLQLTLFPQTAEKGFFVSASGIAGLSTIRADMGGTFAALGLTILMGLRRRASPTLLTFPAIIIISIAGARLIGFALDGFESHSVVAFVGEVAFALVLVTASRRASPPTTN